MVSKGYPLIMPREVYFAIAGLVATEKMSMGKVINMLLREALEARGLIANKKLTDKKNMEMILEEQLTRAYECWEGLQPQAKKWWLNKARLNKHLPIAQEILKEARRNSNKL
jgi:hypothetical protein